MPSRSPIVQLSRVSWAFYLLLLGLIAVMYRVLGWYHLPPGLATTEAKAGLVALAVGKGTMHLGFHPETGYSPLWEVLQSASVSLFGSTATSLRLVAVIIGLAAVFTTYGWAKSWYDRRTAWTRAVAFLI